MINKAGEDTLQKACTIQIQTEADIKKVGQFLCYNNPYKEVNLQYGPKIQRVCVRRIRKAINKWSQSRNSIVQNINVNLYIALPVIDIIQISNICKFAEKAVKLNRNFQIYFDKQEVKSWKIESLSMIFDFSEDSIYFNNIDNDQQIGHKFIRAFWYKNMTQAQRKHDKFEYSQLISQFTKLQQLIQCKLTNLFLLFILLINQQNQNLTDELFQNSLKNLEIANKLYEKLRIK